MLGPGKDARRIGRKRQIDWSDEPEILDEMNRLCVAWIRFATELEANTIGPQAGVKLLTPGLAKRCAEVAQLMAKLQRRVEQRLRARGFNGVRTPSGFGLSDHAQRRLRLHDPTANHSPRPRYRTDNSSTLATNSCSQRRLMSRAWMSSWTGRGSIRTPSHLACRSINSRRPMVSHLRLLRQAAPSAGTGAIDLAFTTKPDRPFRRGACDCLAFLRLLAVASVLLTKANVVTVHRRARGKFKRYSVEESIGPLNKKSVSRDRER